MTCELCKALGEDYRLVCKTEFSFSIVIIEPLKPGHILILPIRHIESLEELNAAETKDLFNLINKMKLTLSKDCSEDPILFMNFGSHATQPHLHFQMLPSKGNIRDLASSFENIPKRVRISEEKLRIMRDKIKKHLQ